MTTQPELFRPIRLGPYELKNRIVMAPLTRNRAHAGNVPNELNAKYYEQRSSAGLIVTEATQVSPEGQGYPNTPGIHTDDQVAGWKLVTEAVHTSGGRIFLQLWHVGRISHPITQPDGKLPVAPSPVRPKGEIPTVDGMRPFETPRQLTVDEIHEIVQQFADGARRAKEAGFDGVEIHGANGYLIEQFLLDGTNHRTDAYGGSIENRTRFLLEITQAVTKIWGADRVGVRLSPRGVFNDMKDSNREAIFLHAVRALDAFGLAYLHVVDPLPGSQMNDPSTGPSFLAKIRAQFSSALIVNGGYDRESAVQVTESGNADLVAFGSAFLANPDLPRRLELRAPLNAPDRTTFYGGDHRGYTDYPTLDELTVANEPLEPVGVG